MALYSLSRLIAGIAHETNVSLTLVALWVGSGRFTVLLASGMGWLAAVAERACMRRDETR
jgi:hypothetical protein